MYNRIQTKKKVVNNNILSVYITLKAETGLILDKNRIYPCKRYEVRYII